MAPQLSLRRLVIATLLACNVSSIPALTLARTPSKALDILSRRALTCADSSDTSCQAVDSRLPGDFCCKSGQTCLSTDTSSTVICCPDGSDCSAIVPISCNIVNQDPSKNPGASVQTTRLTDALPTCGNKCCPFGYSCSDDETVCTLIKSTSSLASNFTSSPQSSSSSVPTATPTTSTALHTSSTSTSTSTNSPTVSGIDSTTPFPSAQCPRFTGVAVVAGFFPGMLLGALLMLLGILFFGTRQPSSRPTSNSSSLYKPAGAIRVGSGKVMKISDPIPLETPNPRTDFLRRTTSRARSYFSRDEPSAMESGYNWKMPTPPVPNNIPIVPASRAVPVTPERPGKELLRQPSTESIRVYSPASALARPESAVAPVRNMQRQREAPEKATIGSPFKTPPTAQRYMYPDESDTAEHLETLTPARYDDGKKRNDRADVSRPTTTFTEMLSGINFPDPGRPPVPQVPKAKKWGNMNRI